ncbi:cysteine protease ATG4C-like [Mya arenaria]|uniref:cysteine protease ATG4C-like n=1 Tax=Mya arenaria TaxID=6604 RepID=UPI0022E19D86|nr:cysteine protease ATG4C-like [Mya arenaria]
MAGSSDSNYAIRSRKHSDDVQSLDSWSELIPESPRNLGETRSRTDMLLSPAKLSTIQEPPEVKITRVKLNKSIEMDNPNISARPLLFSVPPDQFVEKTNSHAKMQQKKHKRRQKHENVQQVSSDISDNSGLSGQSITQCGCLDCKDAGRLGEHNSQLHSSPHRRTAFFKPNYLKQSAQPFQNILSKRQRSKESLENEIEQSEKVKNKLLSVWNNVKYGWTLKPKTSFEKDSPIFLLGSCYTRRPDDDDLEPGSVVHNLPHSMEQFKQDFQSRLWFTYRRDFQALPNTRFTTDCGWGCMLRSSQMMLAQAFIIHFLGRDWRVHTQSKEQETFYRMIIQWFGDSNSDQCPFSVHRLAEIGKTFGKQPGEWYGPSSVAYILRDAMERAASSQPVLKDICVYVAQDCTVYKQDVINMCTARPRNLTGSHDSHSSQDTHVGDAGSKNPVDPGSKEWKRSVIILIPVRLGGEEFNPIYTQCVKNLVAQENCIGLIGGKPKHSLNFIGWQDDKLIYLDPHFCQDYVDTQKRDFKIETYHCFSPRKISLNKMDPSATVGFYCRNKQDFDRFIEYTKQMASTTKNGGGIYPMFVFSEGRGADLDTSDLSMSIERSLVIRHVVRDENGKVRSSTVDSEEFVVL